MPQLNLPQTNQPKVQIIDNQVTTSSVDVAKFFEKVHAKVVRSIEILIEKDHEWGIANFGKTPYTDPQNGQKYQAYNMTRDGFTMLAMSFTGDKAFRFKIAYIQKFNEMEAELSSKPLQLDAPSTKEDRKPLRNLVNALVSAAPISQRDAWHMVHARFGGKHADELSLAEVQSALEFVQSKIDLYCATPEVDFITRQALAGVKAFTARLTVEEAISKTAKAVYREFKANIYITEEKPKHEISAQIDTMLSAHQKRLDRAGIR